MTRKEGFIDVGKMLEEIGVDIYNIYKTDNPNFHFIKNNEKGLQFFFNYHGTNYFYKYNLLRKKIINPYNELVAEELAKDFGIPCIDYDLALFGPNKGVISKNYKQDNVNYIEGKELLGFTSYYDSDSQNDLISRVKPSRNILEDIWDELEIRYHGYPNKRKIIEKLMQRIVNIYQFDILTCQLDRYEGNWQIMESSEFIDIAPLFDNERILITTGMFAEVSLGIDSEWENLWSSIYKFQSMSSDDFMDAFQEKLWIISEENLNKVFERIEVKTGYPMPDKEKEFYLNGYRNHKKRLEKILGLAVEREEEHERKNR